jgi:hypothetical protein
VVTVVATDGAGNARQRQITITRTVADATQPAVTITSHSNNQAVTTASITLRGTATDSGLGGSGITSVTVNGVAAAGGAATGSGTANWSRTVALSTGSNQLTVVARDGRGNTRQVQITVRYQPPVAAVEAVSVTPSSGSGTRQTFTLRYSDTWGASDLDSVRVRIGVSSTTGAGNCTVRHTPGTGVIALLDDAGATWISRTLGSGRVENSQCAVDLASTSVSLSGSVATLTATIEFKPVFSGAKSIYLFAQSVSGLATGWVTRGAWSVPAAITVAAVDAVSAVPSAGSGATQTFALEYADNRGAADLASARVRFGTTATSGANNCTVSYAPSTSTVSMLNDTGTAWLSAAFGAGVLQNSQCAIDLRNSSVAVSGSILRMRLAVTFKAAFAGGKNLYMFAQSVGGLTTGWVTRGSWSVPGTLTVAAVDAVSAVPSSGSGATQTFALEYSDNLGAAGPASARVRFGTTERSGANNCTVSYAPSTSTVSMLNDTGTSWLSAAFGAGVLQNSQCAIDLRNSSVTVSGSVLRMRLAVAFKAAFAGGKNIYMFAQSVSGLATGWVRRGSWTVPGSGSMSALETVGNWRFDEVVGAFR